jgi:hypothetical protein
MLADIDRRHDAGSSVVLRYHAMAASLSGSSAAAPLDIGVLERLSVREGVRTFTLLHHRGVEIVIFDETSLMHTGSLKSVDGCVTTARCLAAGDERVCFESGGNTGTALTTYAVRAGIETFCFVPAANLPLLSSATFSAPTSHLIAVDEPHAVKRVAAAFAAATGIARVPRSEWRGEASTLLGCFLLEQITSGIRYDVLYQTISAAFGPLGIYRVLRAGGVDPLPAFVGVQQAARCEMTLCWLQGAGRDAPPTDDVPLSSVMYDAAPQEYGTYPDLAHLVADTGGWLSTLRSDEFPVICRPRVSLTRDDTRGRATSPLDLLRQAGLVVAERDGQIIDRTGLIALARALIDIDTGRLREGARVLVCVTGGTAVPDGRARPDFWIRDDGRDVAGLVRHFAMTERRSA